MTLGPLMLDVEGLELTSEDRELLKHPLVGGVILFSRNFADAGQLADLVEAIHGIRHPPLLVAVDQEGGRVQRFREPFTRLPAAHLIGRQFDIDAECGDQLAERAGWLMAAELRDVGVDLSFAPVLDLDYGVSEVIGDRAFHSDPEAVARLAGRYASGMRRAGMLPVGKHFPGHGAVTLDSHVAMPEDRREYPDIMDDIVPYERLAHGVLAGVMLAHVIYSALDPHPAGFSRWWIQEELRGRLGFSGATFSDDLSMEGAAVAGSVPDRARAALDAGCDMILVCNDRPGAVQVVDELGAWAEPASQLRLAGLHGRGRGEAGGLRASAEWRSARAEIEAATGAPALVLRG